MPFANALQTEEAGVQTDQAAAAAAARGVGSKILLVGIAFGAGYIAYRWVKSR
jgi:hypothetical protein